MNPIFVVDIEADGPIPGDYSMISIGAVIVEPSLHRTFKGFFKPISTNWIPDALAVSGHTREETLNFADAKTTTLQFKEWVELNTPKGCRAMFISDNNGFDWSFTNWYFHHFASDNPFGHSSTNLQSLYKGLTRDMRSNVKHLRKTRHTHDPLDDALGNAEAVLAIKAKYGLKI